MAKFRANTDDAYILTNIQNQESGDSDWAKYQVTTKDKSRLPLHNGTTNDLLKVFKDTTQAHDIFGDSSAIATYPFDGNANDLGGNYNGTWHGTEQYDTGMFGQAAKFDGSSWISCPYISSFNGNVEWTFSLFYKVISISNSQIFWFGDNGAYGALNISVSDNKIDCRIIGSNIYSVDIDNSWHHIAVINTTSQVKYYHDGELIDVDNINVNIGNGNKGDWFTIASVYGESEYGYFNGLIDQVRIFNRVLTEDEIAFLYHEDLTHIRKHDQLIIYNATDGAKIHEVTSITDNDTDKTYDIDISSLSLTEVPTNVHQLTKSVDLTDKIDTSNTTATTLVLQDALENSTLVKNGETLVIDGYKLENINVTRSLDGGNVKYSIDISSLNHVPSEVVLIKPRVEISVDDENKANADDLVLDVDTNNTITTQIVTNYMSINDSQRTRIKNAEKIDTDTGLDIQVTNVTEEGDGGSPEKFKYTIELAETQSSAPTKAIIRPTIQDILELDTNNTAYDNTNDLVNVYYQPIEKGNGFRSVQVKWNAHRQGDENSSLRVNLWKKVA